MIYMYALELLIDTNYLSPPMSTTEVVRDYLLWDVVRDN